MSEIVWESDAQSSGFTIMSNGMVWPDDWPGTLVEAQFTSARGDGADLDRDPDMVPSGPGRVTFTPLVRTVGYDGEHGKRIVSLHPFEAVVGDDGYLYTPDEYGQPGIRGIVLPSNNSDVVDEHDWTWRVTFDIPDTTIRPTHIPTPHDHSVDIKDYLDSDANHGVRVVVDRVAARETLTARDEVIQARDLVLPARDETLTARDETLALGLTVDTSVGTRVYVGDTMIHGDTGWRTIHEWDSEGNIITGTWEELSGWGVASNASANGSVSVRRLNNVVYYRMNNIEALTNLPRLSMPSGFRPGSRDYVNLAAYSRSSVDGERTLFLLVGGTQIYFTARTGHLGDSNYPISFDFSVSTSWPTSLPGTPR